MASGERPSPEEIVLYEKDPETKIATITFNRPESAERADIGRAAALRRPAARRDIDDDVKVLVIRGDGDDFGSGADLPEFMAGTEQDGCCARSGSTTPRRHVSARRHLPPRRDDRASGTPTLRRAAGRSRSSRRSASSRPRATATAGTSTSAPTPTSSSPPTTRFSATPRSATSAGPRGCGGGR